MFEVGYHFGFEKLKDEKILDVVDADDFDFNKRLFTIKVRRDQRSKIKAQLASGLQL